MSHASETHWHISRARFEGALFSRRLVSSRDIPPFACVCVHVTDLCTPSEASIIGARPDILAVTHNAIMPLCIIMNEYDGVMLHALRSRGRATAHALIAGRCVAQRAHNT